MGRALDQLYDTGLTTLFTHLSRQAFHCREDALQAAELWAGQWTWHNLQDIQVLEEVKHQRSGRPKKGGASERHFFVKGKPAVDQARWERDIFQRSLFVLATNEAIDTPEQEQELLVYSALEYKIRQAIQQEDNPIPDQKGKPTERPTASWVFQFFVGIHVLALPDGGSIVLNLDQTHRNIIDLLSYWNFYS